jgi:hypothetical protein
MALTEKQIARKNESVPELLGAKEVADELGVRVSNLERVVGLPAEVGDLACGRIWRADVIRPFADERRERRAAEKRQAAERRKQKAAEQRAVKRRREAAAKRREKREREREAKRAEREAKKAAAKQGRA